FRSSVLPPLPAPSAQLAASLAQRLDRPASAPEAAGHRDSVPPERQLAEARALVNSIDGWSVCGCLSVNMKQRTQWVFTSGVYSQLASPGAAQRRRRAVFVNCGHAERHAVVTTLSAECARPVLDALLGGAAGIQRPGRPRASPNCRSSWPRIPLRLARTAVVSPESVAAGRAASEATGRPAGPRRLWRPRRRGCGRHWLTSRARKTAKGEARRATGAHCGGGGLTNAGKTSLVSLLARKSSLLPEDRLFRHPCTAATTACRLPCGLPCLLVDTIGFLSDHAPPAWWPPFRCTLRRLAGRRPAAPPIRTGRNGAGQFRTRWTNSDCPRSLRNGMLTVYNKCDLLLD
uniref:G domain-containing protein n=1 Tax=Macrostomum lignano TaxID=282301 RepID=A0A1I8FMZ4_9PLAT